MSASFIFFTGNERLGKPGLNFSTMNTGEKVKLEFSIINPTNAVYSIQAKLYDNQVIDFNSEIKQGSFNNKLIFEKFLVCYFFFEREQDLFIILKKNDYPIEINTTLGRIIGLNQCTYTHQISNNEALLIKAEKIGNDSNLLKFNFILKESNSIKNFFVNNKYYYIICSNNKRLYLSEHNDNNGTFLPAHIPTSLLQPFYSVNFYNTQNQLITTINKSLPEIFSQNNRQPKKIQLNNDCLYIYDNSTIIKDYTFIDYINAGVIIALSIGIDFTGSNGHPLDDGTLHSIKDGQPNDYERAIISCGYIVAFYDYDQLFPVYGFGAKINGSPKDEVSMCFNLNFKNNPDIYTIDNIIKTYHDLIEKDKLTFSGPTKFTPLLKEVISRINKNNIFEYHILMILTDGVIDDLEDTIDILVEASKLPLSVIIIGIGGEDFTKMEILDGDDVPLRSRSGKIRERDLVQFVPFSRFKNDANKLSMEVLAEIPRQMIEFYQFKNLDPNTIRNLIQQQNNKNNIGNNYNNNYPNNGYNQNQNQNQNFFPQNSNYNNNNYNNNNFNQQGNNSYPLFYDNTRQKQNNNKNGGNMTHRNYQSNILNQNVQNYQNNNNFNRNNLNTNRNYPNKYNNNIRNSNMPNNNYNNNNMLNNSKNRHSNPICTNDEYLSNNNFNGNSNLSNNNSNMMNINNKNNKNNNSNGINNNNNNNNNINIKNNSEIPFEQIQNKINLDDLPLDQTLYLNKK